MNRQILKFIVFIGLFTIPFVPFLVSSSLFFPFITTKAFAWRIIVEIIFAAWAVLAVIDVNYRPKKSLTTYALLVFILVIGVSNMFGVEPVKSFWSNAERMEGYVSLLHLGMFFLVIRNFFDEIDWERWWNTSLTASFLMAVYCLFQLAGAFEIHQGGARVDGTLGNAAYLAVYMLFHVFIALYFLARSKTTGLRITYGALALLNAFIIYESATRGTILGLLGGLLVVSILGLRSKNNPFLKKFSIGYLGVFLIIVLGFFSLRNSNFVQSSQTLSRFSHISVNELKGEGRAYVWPIALKGVVEKPLFGWGQENFNYVFNEHYSPEMFRLEPWFDRAHNIFLDWAIAGGIFGLLTYLALYYVLLRAVWKSTSLKESDKYIIVGLVAAYFFHNIFVFDHLISYVLFISLLAFADSNLEKSVQKENRKISDGGVINLLAPVALVALVAFMYFVNIRPMSANATLISGLQNLNGNKATQGISDLKEAYGKARLGRPEIVEQIVSNTSKVLDSGISSEEKNDFYLFAKNAIDNQVKELEGDTRYEILAGSFYSNVGNFEEALAHLLKARDLTPTKQIIYYEIASAYINQSEFSKSLEALKSAYDLNHDNLDALTAYLVGAIYAKDKNIESQLKAELLARSPSRLTDDRVIGAYVSAGRYAEVIQVFKSRIESNPKDSQNYINLAALYLKANDKQGAINTLLKLGSTLPDYKKTADGYIDQIKNGTIK